MLAREQHIRDEAVYDEKIKLMRNAVSVCYKQYHVNHAYKCRPLYVEYLDMIQHKNGILHNHPREIVRRTPDTPQRNFQRMHREIN
jgi:uncharacterized protein YdaL